MCEVNCKSPPLIMGKGAEVQLTWVVMAYIKCKYNKVEHNFAIVESAKHTFLWEWFLQKSWIVVDHQGWRVYQHRELKAAGLATLKFQSHGQENSKLVQPVAKVRFTREHMLMIKSESLVECEPGWIGSFGSYLSPAMSTKKKNWSSYFMWRWLIRWC